MGLVVVPLFFIDFVVIKCCFVEMKRTEERPRDYVGSSGAYRDNWQEFS